MDQLGAFIDSLNQSNWIALVAVVVATIGGTFTALNYFAGRRERKLRTYEIAPEVKATINATRYEDRWRSVQLHIVAAAGQQKNFQNGDWHIERARLLRPWNAMLARAENDDCATGVFYPENPVRALEGKAEGRVQRFALEFFIKFKDKNREKKAKFKVTFSDISKRRRHTTIVWAIVPPSAE